MLALALGGFGIGTTEFVTMGLLPDIAAAFGISEPTAGHAVSAYALGVVVGAPLIAALCARVPRKKLLIALMAAFTVGNAATVLAPTFGTLVLARFVSGLPHGAYFGVASLAAATLAPVGQRAKAVAAVMLGLSVANVIGVPGATWLGQHLGWRDAYVVVAVIGVATVAALWRFVPGLTGMKITNPMTELGALRRPQVLLTLAVGAIGFGGMFAVYTYITTTMTDVAGMSIGAVPIVLALFGLGMIAGNILGGIMADRGVDRSIFAGMIAMVVILAGFVLAAHNPITAAIGAFLVGASGAALAPGLQTRLMDVAADAQTLAAALNHAALNIANAAGAWLGGLVIAAGFGYTAPAAVGALLAVLGLLLFAVTVWVARRGEAVATTS
ncbi:MFS transporter [Nocardia asteroides NBRC 15531]|uniref:Major facilitator superfamily transporter n=1 Tax=Nocardia asteroides NBRC 15531 TaxID=1110697 RepID=U5ERF7_NOCAS|nr:MFS transporter [Nocardia asteroides]TLF65833.1 MFS transporter [Nocardia asteroides NBRC 15531]UGT52183.1 MFS transporter [Nocardia asteroides]SFM50525.1 MFS transporter, DHA1 family, inner membrane transport protein [Nocardia asteroides]VEG33458.1 Inner membrane transport protein ydhP [Nocardia asteroides]GAD87699.1 putative major facilitator superfamily transporter [Nocardia asteroides NBRC 15531]